MASQRSIEVKVGLLILAAVILLGGFVLVMGGISYEPTYEVLVGFDNPGGLKAGAPVKVAGMTVGKIDTMEFSGGGLQARGEEPVPLVRARVELQKRYQDSIRDNAVFYVTMEGVLGEPFLAIEPGSSDRPPIQDGTHVRGLDPPRIDRVVAEAYDLLTHLLTAMRQHRPALGEIIVGAAKTLKGTGHFMEHNQDRLDRIAANLEQLSVDGVDTVQAARRRYVDNPQIDRILTNTEQLSATAARDLPPLLRDGRETLGGVKRVVDTVSSDAELARIKRVLADVSDITAETKATVRDARVIASHIRQGRGSVGALVMDEQLFDDLQEMARDLKHNPWKFFWKE